MNACINIQLGPWGAVYATIDSPWVQCSGIYGLNHATITASQVNVYAEECALYATIKAKDKSLIVEFYGWKSADYAEIICESGDFCWVKCGSRDRPSGCTSNTELKCHTGASCHWDCAYSQDDCVTVTNVA